MSEQQQSHKETGPLIKFSSERREKLGNQSYNSWIHSLVCYPLHYWRSMLIAVNILGYHCVMSLCLESGIALKLDDL